VSGESLIELEAVLRERLAGTLPGLEAQLRFMPTPPRTGWKPGEFPSDARIGLRGGAPDRGDAGAGGPGGNAHEEIGVDPAGVRILGELTPVYVLVSGFTLHPVVGITHHRPTFAPAAREVEAVLEVSVADLQDASRIRHGTRTREGVAIEYPYFDLLGHQVWGATAMILGEFICLL